MQVLDSLVTLLAKHTSLLSTSVPQASIAFGGDEMSCMATETMFELANRCAATSLQPSCHSGRRSSLFPRHPGRGLGRRIVSTMRGSIGHMQARVF